MAKKIIDSDDLIKENLKLKKENEWDKHKIAYLESMLELNGIDPNKYTVKKREEVILSALTNKDVKNITILCAIAGISREANYKYLRTKDKETLNSQILEVIRSVQKETSYAIGHRPMKEECK
ncbi:MAG: hypothetical protein PQJ45_03170 [Sphaerochaetaceae bacterium]|nr:hypothetical protein [Sphaerochaetaceae bacterium]